MTVNLTALDLNKDGKSELIGYQTTVLQYERFTMKDMMSGADLTAIDNGVYLERLVDALDLDGDGASEVITVRDGLEGDGYQIYKKKNAKWTMVYEFANYRCAF
jgi:hypothetical protein